MEAKQRRRGWCARARNMTSMKTLCLSCYSTHVVIVIIFHMAAISIVVRFKSIQTQTLGEHRPSSSSLLSSLFMFGAFMPWFSLHIRFTFTFYKYIAIQQLTLVQMRINSLKLIKFFFPLQPLFPRFIAHNVASLVLCGVVCASFLHPLRIFALRDSFFKQF